MEPLVVNRPLRDVAATFRERASACLQTVTRTYSAHHAPLGTVTEFTYTPTVVEVDGRVELHLQVRQTVAIEIGPMNPKGFYTFVAVATALDPRRTQPEILVRHARRRAASGSREGLGKRKLLGMPGLELGSVRWADAVLVALTVGACATPYVSVGRPNLHIKTFDGRPDDLRSDQCRCRDRAVDARLPRREQRQGLPKGRRRFAALAGGTPQQPCF